MVEPVTNKPLPARFVLIMSFRLARHRIALRRVVPSPLPPHKGQLMHKRLISFYAVTIGGSCSLWIYFRKLRGCYSQRWPRKSRVLKSHENIPQDVLGFEFWTVSGYGFLDWKTVLFVNFAYHLELLHGWKVKVGAHVSSDLYAVDTSRRKRSGKMTTGKSETVLR